MFLNSIWKQHCWVEVIEKSSNPVIILLDCGDLLHGDFIQSFSIGGGGYPVKYLCTRIVGISETAAMPYGIYEMLSINQV